MQAHRALQSHSSRLRRKVRVERDWASAQPVLKGEKLLEGKFLQKETPRNLLLLRCCHRKVSLSQALELSEGR